MKLPKLLSFGHLAGAPVVEEASENEPDDTGTEPGEGEEANADHGAPPAAGNDVAAQAGNDAAAARIAERRRCASILGSEHAAGRVEAACQLAFGTDLTADQAIGVLKAMPKAQAAPPKTNRLAAVMPAAQPPAIGTTEAVKDDSAGLAASIISNFEAVRGIKRA